MRSSAVRAALLTFFFVMIVTWRPSDDVLGRLFVPDGIEYAVGAQRLATLGRYDIVVDGVAHPPRYPPGFSTLLAPAYWMAPDDLAAGVWISRAIWAAGCAALAYGLAGRFGLPAALLTLAAVNFEPTVARAASTIMSDAPGAAALLALLAIRMSASRAGTRTFVAAGVVLGIGAACRPLTALAILAFVPLIRHAPHRWRAAAALIAPTACVAVAIASYNRAAFGSFAMNGYAYWMPAPYARFDFVFHPVYLPRQLAAISTAPSFYLLIAAGIAAAVLIAALDRPARSRLLLPLLLLALPLTIVQLFYFYIQIRLYLPVIVACCLCVGLAAGMVLGRVRIGRYAAAGIALVLAALTLQRGLTLPNPGADLRISLLEQMRAALPQRCAIVTFLEPTLMEAVVTHGTERRWISAQRDQEYSNKPVATEPIDLADLPRPPSLRKVTPALLARGARFTVPLTADDEQLLDELAGPDAAPAFVDLASVETVRGLRERLERRFILQPVQDAPLLLRCVVKPSAPEPGTRPASNPSGDERPS